MFQKPDPLHAILDAIEDVKTLHELDALLDALRVRNTMVAGKAENVGDGTWPPPCSQ